MRFKPSRNPVEQLCEDAGLAICYQSGHSSVLSIEGGSGSPCLVYVVHTPGSSVMSLYCESRAKFPDGSVPDGLSGFLLARNKANLCCWQLDLDDDPVSFACSYKVFAHLMDSHAFRLICAQLVSEVTEVEQVLRGKGLL
jgi:hypothetical protein